MSESGAPIYQ